MTTHLEWRTPFTSSWHTAYSPATDTRYSVGPARDDDGRALASLVIRSPTGIEGTRFFDSVDGAKVAAERHHAERMRTL